MFLLRRITSFLFFIGLMAGSLAAHGDGIVSADLQIQGSGLRVITVSVSTGIDIPVTIQTEFGGKQNDDAPHVDGLIAAGDLSGPGIDTPIRIETEPGHKFSIPGLSRAGDYLLQNVRLMKDGEFLQSATPSIAAIRVSNLLETSVKVRQLTPEELRARGITIDERNFEVYEYTFSFFVDGKVVEIPFPVVIDKRTHEVREITREDPYKLPPIQQVVPPRWTPPYVAPFELGPGADFPAPDPKDPEKGGGRPSIPAALVIPNNLAVLHQFFAVTLMVTNGAPEGSSVVLDSVNAVIKPPAELRTVKSLPPVAFNQAVPIVDPNTGVTFLVAQAKGSAEWTMEGLKPGTHQLEVEVHATYKSPGQADFPLKGTVRSTIVVHDPRFNINFSHPDTVRKGIDYSTYSFITNMSGVPQTLHLTNALQACSVNPTANVCRLDSTPEFFDLTIPAGEMRMVEYKLHPNVTGHVFASAGSVSDDNITASVQLFMGVSESGIPLSPVTLVLPYYARYVSQDLISPNLQLLGLGYSLATAPLTQALASHPRVIKTDVFERAVDVARAGQRIFLGEDPRDSMAHMSLDLLGNRVELREWDDLRRQEKSGRGADASVVRELEKGVASGTTFENFVARFATTTAHRGGYGLALVHGPAVSGNTRPYALSAKLVSSGARLDIPNEAESGWVRDIPYGALSTFTPSDHSGIGELAMFGRWTTTLELSVTPSVSGPFSLEVIYPATADGSLLRAHVDLTGTAGKVLTLSLDRGQQQLSVRDDLGGIAAVPTVVSVQPDPIHLIGARQDMYLDDSGHKVSVLFSRPVTIADGDDWLTKFHAAIHLNKDGVNYNGNRPMSAAALQGDGRVVNITFDHALSQNATYSMTVDPVIDPLIDPLTNNTVSFSQPLTPVIDNDRPGAIIYGHVFKGDNTPIANAEVRLQPEGPQQFDLTPADGTFLFEFVPRDIDNSIQGTYRLEATTTEGKNTFVEGAVRLPGRVHFVNLIFLGRGSAQGYVRYDNGEVVKKAHVVIGSTMFDQFRSGDTDDNGFYSIEDLPVGPLTFSATDAAGNTTFGASEIKTPGQVLIKDLSIFRRPFPGVATVRGIVLRSDTSAAVPGAHVGVYSQGYGLIDGFTDSAGKFEFTKVPTGFVTVLASEWSVSLQSVALDFDLATDETRDVTMTLNVAPNVPLAQIEGDVIRENPLFPGDASKYEKVAGALVKIDSGQAVTADANGHYVYQPVPTTFAGHTIAAYDPATKRTASTTIPTLDPTKVNPVPIFISAASGFGEGTIRVRVYSAAGFPISGLRVIEPGYPPTELVESGAGVYQMAHVPVGSSINIWAISTGGAYGDQFMQGNAKVEFNGHVASLNFRFGGQGTVRVKLVADIDVIGDVKISYPVWDEEEQGLGSKEVTRNSAKNGVADYAVFDKVPALLGYSVASQHPVYGYAGQGGKLGFDGDVQSITLQLNKLSTVRGTVYAIDGRTPVAGAIVHIEDGRQNQGTFATLPDGTYVFFNEPASTGFRVVAEITQDGVYRTGYGAGSTPALGGPVNNVSVLLRTQGSVDGRIVYAGFKKFDPQNPANNIVDDTPNDLSDNAPVPLAKFQLREFDFPSRNFGSTSSPLTADVLGRFTINNLFTGPLRVDASDPNNQENRGSFTGTLTQEGERLTAYVAIGTTGFGAVTVSVTDPNNLGAAVYNAEVSIFRGIQVFDFATTDGNGIAHFDQLPVGTYTASAYSKALGRSGAGQTFTITVNGDTPVRISLVFSGKVTGRLTDPEKGGIGIPGAPITLSAFNYSTRTSTEVTGNFLFEGVREGTFTLDAKDTLSNRRASASRALSQADPEPYVALELEPTETLYASAYLPADDGSNSNVLAPIVNIDVTQRNGDFIRSLQGNSFQMPQLFRNSPYNIAIREVGGQQREIHTSGSFPNGNSANPLKLVFQAFGTVEVHVTQAGVPAVNARVSVSGGGRSATIFTDASGVAIASGIGLGTIYIQAVTVDGAFSASATSTLNSQSTPAIVSLALGAFAGVTGYVEAETGGPSVGTRVIASFGRVLEVFTDSNGRYTFQGIPAPTGISIVYMGPDDITVGARQSYNATLADASHLITLPNVKLDATPPTLVSFFPADGAQNVSPDATLRFTFSEPIGSNYINTNYFQLVPADSSNALNVIFNATPNADGTFTVTMTPPAAAPGEKFPLKSNTLYRIIISGEIRDLTGNKMPATRGGSFITSDYAEPHVIRTTPAVTSPLQAATTFIFTFNEPIDPAPWQTGGAGVFHLYKISAAGPAGAILAEKPGHAYVDPTTGLSLNFAPNDPIEQQSFYRVVFSGIRDLQGNLTPEQTFHFFSFDLIKPVVTLISPVPDTLPLISGVQYTLKLDLKNPDGSAATDVSRVDFFRMDGATQTFLFTTSTAPFSYTFVGPDVPEGGSTLTLRAIATDQSANISDPATMSWNVQPNKPPQNMAITLTPTSAYASNRVNASVAFSDEGTFATVQVDATGSQSDGTTWTKSLVKQATRLTVDTPWQPSSFDFDLPSILTEGTTATFNATVTDVRGQKGTASAQLSILADAVNPTIITVNPAAETRYTIGSKYQIDATVGDNEGGVKSVTFAFDNQVITVPVTNTTLVTPGTQAHTWKFTSGQITVPAKNIDTRIPITITATDYHGNTVSTSVEVIYVGVNDPTVPKGAWLCPVDHATFPASTSLPVTLQVNATDDIAVTGVKFVIPGVTDPVPATRVGTTDTYQATVTLATPVAGTPYLLTAIISDANSTHDVQLTAPIEFVSVDITIDDRTQAVLSTDLATYQGKSIMVRGTLAHFVPHVPLTLKNLIVLNGGHVETLATTTTTEQKLDLTVSDHLYVDCASFVDVSARGYLGGWGVNSDGSNTKNNDARGMTVGNSATNGPTSGASASYAGLGGQTGSGVTNAAYGSLTNPFDLGTGGAGNSGCCQSGGQGGGAVRINGGTQPGDLGILVIAGSLKADGGTGVSTAEAGSGGSINVTAKQFIAGPSARITANGGDDDAVNQASRGAGGGRIAINASDRFSVDTMGLQIQARGGRNNTSSESATYLDGGAGTIFTKRPGESFGELYVSSYDERAAASIHLTRPTPLGAVQLDRLELGARALVRADDTLQIGTKTNDRTAAIIDPTAVLVLPADQPTISVTPAPAAGTTLVQGATIAPSYSAASIAGVGSVTLAWTPVTPNRVDSYFNYPATAVANNVSLAIPATTPAGPATLTLTATDRAGRSITSSATAYTISVNQPPTIDKFLVTPLSLYPGKSVTATISATDELSVTKLTLTSTINNGTPAVQTKTPNTVTVTDSVFTVNVPIDTPGNAPMTLVAGAEDNFPGHTATTQTTPVTILKDTNPPSLTVTSPTANQLFLEGTGATIPIRATAVDAEVGVKTAYVQIDGGTQIPLVLGSGGTYSADIPVPSVDGSDNVTKQVVVTVKDYEGNTNATTPIAIQIKPLFDPNAPVVAWSCPSTGALFPAGYSAKLRMYAIGNNVGNQSNGVQKVEFFVNESTTAITAAPVSGLANYYEATFAIPSDATAGTVFSVRGVATNVSGSTNDAGTSFTIVTGTKITANTTISASDTSFDNKVVIVQSGTTTILGNHTFDTLIVLDGANVTHPATDAVTTQKLTITTTHELFVSCTGSIDVSGRGYLPNNSYPGATTPGDGSGGSHIGVGGLWNPPVSTTYGSVYRPSEAGGGGEHPSVGAPGGGIIRITAESLTNDGAIRANGGSNQRSGAGGSVWITTGALTGLGAVEAHGGDPGQYGSGGGGAIAIEYTSGSPAMATLLNRTGTSNSQNRFGGAGSTWIKGPSSTYGDLIVDNKSFLGQATSLPSLGNGTALGGSSGATLVTDRSTNIPAFFAGHWVEISTSAGALKGSWRIATINAKTVTLTPNGSETISISAGDKWQGVYRFDNLSGGNGETIVSPDPIRLGAGSGVVNLTGSTGAGRYTEIASMIAASTDVVVTGNVSVLGLSTPGNVTVKNGAILTHPASGTTANSLTVAAGGAVTIENGGAIDASGRGYPQNVSYPGATTPGDGSGGSHMGIGGLWNGPLATTFGSVYRPSEAGGGGEHSSVGAPGGGVVRITSATLTNEGAIRANGASNQRSGAGGSVWITTGTLLGAGAIEAHGGDPAQYGSGGGGAIAIEYTSGAVTANLLNRTGTSNSQNRFGGAGTTWIKGPSSTFGDLTIDNKGFSGQATQLPSLGNGVAQSGSSNATLVTDRTTDVPAYFVGHWVEISTSAGALKGTWRVASINAKTVTLAPNTNETISISAGDKWQGVYRFDNFAGGNGELLVSPDPIRLGANGGVININGPVTAGKYLELAQSINASADVVINGNVSVLGINTPGNVTVKNGAILTHPASGTTAISLTVNAGGAVTVENGGAIDVGGRGYPQNVSYPGAITPGDGSGGSHMGIGGLWNGPLASTFGSVYRPSEAGGGGEHPTVGAPGGGVVRITSATLTNDGAIRANGASNQRSGAGGSVWITTGTLSGAGAIEAHGGDPAQFGSGGGGAIAIEYTGGAVTANLLNRTGTSNSQNRFGGAGTIYVKGPSSTYGDLTIDNKGFSGQATQLPSLGNGVALSGSSNATLVTDRTTDIPAYFAGHWVEISTSAGALKGTWRVASINAKTVTLAPNTNETISISAGDKWQGVYRFDNLSGGNGELLVSPDPIRLSPTSGTININGPVTAGKYLELAQTINASTNVVINGNVSILGINTPGNVTVKNGAILTHPASGTTANSLTITATGAVTIESSGAVDVGGRGYPQNVSYPGATTPGDGSGGSHMGIGGLWNGPLATTFGSVYRPSEAGGGGEHPTVGAPGGGVVRITSATLTNDGAIRANGASNQRSGAGGSIWITTGALSGAGAIEAHGGDPAQFGSGGGGAIAIEYTSGAVTANLLNRTGTSSSQNRFGGAGTIWIKGPSSTFGDLTIDNKGFSGQATQLPSLGNGVAQSGSSNATLVTNRTIDVQPYFIGNWVEVRDVSGALKGKWRIATINAKTITLAPNGSETISIQSGDTYRGIYRFDTLKLRSTKLTVEDRLDVTAALDLDASSTITGNNQGPPTFNTANISLSSNSTGSSVIGTAGAVSDPDKPIAMTATNTTSGNVYTATANADGSFTIALQGNAGETITLKAKDGSIFPLESPVITIGQLTSGTPAASQIDKATWTSDAGFKARVLANDATRLLVASNSGSGSDKLVILNITDPAHLSLVRTVTMSNGAINDIAIAGGWAYIAANDLQLLDLSSGTSTPVTHGDVGNIESSIVVANGYAFTTTPHNNDARIRIYDVSTPSVPRFMRDQPTIGSMYYRALTSYGTNYLVAFSPDKPGAVGHDVVVFDRTNVFNLVKVGDLDIPNFDATNGRVIGSKVYVTSLTSPDVYVVDLANPAAPAVLGKATVAGNSSGLATLKNDVFVAAGSAGLVDVDVTNPATPAIAGSFNTGGVAYDVTLQSPWAYVANDNGLAVIPLTNPPPQVDSSRVSMSLQGATLVISGGLRSITGSGALTVIATDSTSGAVSVTQGVAADGTFTISLAAKAGDSISIEATDATSHTSGPVSLGIVPFGSGAVFTPIPPAISEQNFRPRSMATDGTTLIVGGWADGSTTKVVLFDVTDPANPVYKRNVAVNNGAINDVAIRNGYAIINANDVSILDLGNPNLTPVYLPDIGNIEYGGVVSGGYLFNATPHNNDGRLRIYDVSSPTAARWLRDQTFVGSMTFYGMASYGQNYIIAFSSDRPGGVGHDVVIIDKTNINNLVKVADIDIAGASFGAFRGKVVGSTLYVAGTNGGVAVVDIADPKNPVFKTIIPASEAYAVDLAGTIGAVADGSAGVTFLDTTNAAAPVVTGTQAVGGSAWSVLFNHGNLYVANEQGIVVIQNLATAPIVSPSLVTVSPYSGTMATVTGSARSVTGITPLTIEVKNTRSGASISGQSVGADGSFSSILISASVGDPITVEATDPAGRKSGPTSVGIVPFGSAVAQTVITPAMSEANYHARTLANDTTNLIVGGYADGGSTKALQFDVSDPANPVYKRALTLSNGAINDVAVSNGWAFIAANDIWLLDLSNPLATPFTPGDIGNTETALLPTGGYLFTVTPHNNDGRIRIYDISNPTTPRWLRDQSLVGSMQFYGIAPVSDNYIAVFSSDRPGGVGHDLVIFDKSNVYSLVKVADIDIGGSSFNAFRGKVVGTTLYLAGTTGGVAVVDVSNPKSPVVKKIIATAGTPFGTGGSGNLIAVADGGAGVTFLDGTNSADPQIIGTQPVGGTSWSLSFNRGNIYVANEQGLAVIRNVGAAPLVSQSLIGISADGIGNATVTGAAGSITGTGSLTIDVRDTRGGAAVTGFSVANDGSFTVTLAALPGDPITVEATDSAARKSGAVFVGTVPFGSSISTISITPAMSETNYHPRTLASDGRFAITGGWQDGGTTKLSIFDLTDPAHPLFQRSVALNNGAINSVAISNGYAVVTANDLVLLDLTNSSSTPVVLPDIGNIEWDISISNGLAFTTTPHNNDGRIRIYDISNPAAARWVRDQAMVGSVSFYGLTTLGDDYLVATGTNHDVVIIDRRDPNALVTVRDFDIPAFDGFRGKVIGSTFYLAGTTGGLAIVDLSNPASPVLKSIVQTTGDPYGVEWTGSTVAVADGSAGITFLDATNPNAPTVLGTQPTGGFVWSSVFNRGHLYAVNEQGLVVISNVASAPVVDRSLVTITNDGSGNIAVNGAAGAVTGIAPVTASVKNVTTSVTSSATTVAGNGSFSAALAAVAGHALTLLTSDHASRSGALTLGQVPFGAVTTYRAGSAQAANDTSYRARRIATNGTLAVMTTGSTYGLGIPSSRQLLTFDVATGAVRNYLAGNGQTNDVVMAGGYAFIASDDFASVNVADPAATAFFAPDQGNTETSVVISGNYAFTTTPHNNDGRIRLYDITNPAHPTWFRDQAMLGSTAFLKIVRINATYLAAITPDRPGSVGHDVVILDVTNPSSIVKVGDFDINGSSFNGFDATVDGSTLYVVGGDAGVAIVDIASPSAPVVKSIVNTPGIARGVAVSGTNEIAVADGAGGITFVDTTDKSNPVIRGTQQVPGNSVGVAVTGKTVLAASERYFNVINRP